MSPAFCAAGVNQNCGIPCTQTFTVTSDFEKRLVTLTPPTPAPGFVNASIPCTCVALTANLNVDRSGTFGVSAGGLSQVGTLMPDNRYNLTFSTTIQGVTVSCTSIYSCDDGEGKCDLWAGAPEDTDGELTDEPSGAEPAQAGVVAKIVAAIGAFAAAMTL